MHARPPACTDIYSALQTRPDQTTCAKIASYRPDHARAPVVIYRLDQTTCAKIQTRPDHAVAGP